MKKVICLIALVMVMPLITGCYVAPGPGPYYGHHGGAWVPGHYGPYGGWIPGHWA